jgi:hypothetical protein
MASNGRQKGRPCLSQSCCSSGNDRAKLDRVTDKLAIKWRARSLPMAFLAARCHREDFGTILVAALSAVVDYA